MSDKIQVPLEFHNRHHVEVFAHFLRREARELPDAGLDFVAEQVEAALPPEYPEGAVAWVTTVNQRCICIRKGDGWAIDDTQFRIYDDAVTKVEPLRVLADDEIAVKRQPSGDPDVWRSNADYARTCEGRYHPGLIELATAYADALDAEAKS